MYAIIEIGKINCKNIIFFSKNIFLQRHVNLIKVKTFWNTITIVIMTVNTRMGGFVYVKVDIMIRCIMYSYNT